MSFMPVLRRVLGLSLWLRVVSGIWVSVGTLNAPYSPGWMGAQDCPLFLFKGLFHILQPEGDGGDGGGGLVCVPSALLLCLTPLVPVFSLSPVLNIHITLPTFSP